MSRHALPRMRDESHAPVHHWQGDTHPARWQDWVLDEDDYSDAGSYNTKEPRR